MHFNRGILHNNPFFKNILRKNTVLKLLSNAAFFGTLLFQLEIVSSRDEFLSKKKKIRDEFTKKKEKKKGYLSQ